MVMTPGIEDQQIASKTNWRGHNPPRNLEKNLNVLLQKSTKEWNGDFTSRITMLENISKESPDQPKPKLITYAYVWCLPTHAVEKNGAVRQDGVISSSVQVRCQK